MKQFLETGFKAVIVCVNEKLLDKSFCGREVDEQLCNDLPPGVDICGENGEFHTFVYDGPIFEYPLNFEKREIVHKEYKAPKTLHDTHHPLVKEENTGFYFCDLVKA
jgi:diphthamide synthase (EF-2-diphthine--ammonia ligase)